MTSPERREAARTIGLAALGGAGLAAVFLLLSGPGSLPGRGDLADFFWPMKSYTAGRWRSGQLPLWNPLSACGEPWLAQLQSGALNPLDLVFLAPWPWGPRLAIAAILAVASSGMAAWLSRLGASRAAAVTAALLFAGAAPFGSLVVVLNNAATAAWLPWLLATARTAVLALRPAPFSFCLAMAFVGGEPSLALAGGLVALLVALFSGPEGELGPSPPRSRSAGAALVGLLLGVALAGASLLPFAELLAGSGRLAGTPRAEALARPIGPSDLADLTLPPSAHVAGSAAEGRGAYLGSLSFGLLPLILSTGAAAGFPGRPRLLAAVALVASAALLFSMGDATPLARALLSLGPLRGVRFPARFFVFVHAALSFGAAAGFDGWLYGRFARPARSAWREAHPDDPSETAARASARRSTAVGGLLLLLLLPLLALPVVAPGGPSARDPFGTLLLVCAAAAGTLLVSYQRYRPTSRAPAALLAAACVAPLPWTASGPLAPVPAADLHGSPPIVRGLSGAPGSPRVFPVVRDPTLLRTYLSPGTATWSPEVARRSRRALAGYTNLDAGIPSAASASPIPNPRISRLFGAALAGGNPAKLLALGNVRWVVTPFPAAFAGVRLDARDAEIRRYDLGPALGRVFFPASVREADDDAVFGALCQPGFDPEQLAFVAPGSHVALPPPASGRRVSLARVVKEEPERLEMECVTAASTMLVVTRAHDPGWKAELDGRPVERVLRVDLALMGLVVPAGTHRVVLRYLPDSLLWGAALSAAAVLALVGLSLRGPSRPGA